MMVDCFPIKKNPWGWKHPNSIEVDFKKVFPFFRTGFGKYTHRIRSATSYYWSWVDGQQEYRHTSFHFWCGQVGFASEKREGFKLMSEPEAGAIMCATCEGRAIGSGQLGTHEIAGRLVKFSPRI